MEEKLEMINAKQAFLLPLRAAHCVTATVLQHPCRTSAQDQHRSCGELMSLPAWACPVPVAVWEPLPFSRASSAVPALAWCAWWQAGGQRLPSEAWVSKQGADGTAWTCRVGMSPRSPCSRRSQRGFLHHPYARWQHITLLCCWAGFKVTNTPRMQRPAIFSLHRKEKPASGVGSVRVRILPTPQAHLFSLKRGALPFQRAMKTLQ